MKPRILLVEDDEFISTLVQTVLTQSGLEVMIIDRLEALRLLEPFDFDAVVTDFQLPGANGCDVIEYVRERAPGIPALVVSGHGDIILDSVASRGLADVHTLNKPFHLDELLSKVGKMLSSCRVEGEGSLHNAGTGL